MKESQDLHPATRNQYILPELLWSLFRLAASYRLEMPVIELMVISGNCGYYLCPRCKVSLDREFASFCDRCGQKLGWAAYRKAKLVYPMRTIKR